MERLLKRRRVDERTGCWLWTGATTLANRTGYGRTWRNGKHVLVHRLAFELAGSLVPSGLFLLHRCDRPLCFNPDHLYVGTHADNMRQRNDSGRQAKGSTNAKAKLSEADVLEMRRSMALGVHPAAVAKKYGVTPSIAYNIRANRIWKHVTARES